MTLLQISGIMYFMATEPSVESGKASVRENPDWQWRKLCLVKSEDEGPEGSDVAVSANWPAMDSYQYREALNDVAFNVAMSGMI
mmetsp:Transcript_9423/g.17883  ORF Transcript_9423/g.17883 Transcript_9423/m.17883 type:complete len:84 (-) Transcript_9423:143-394(-)|eukprot:CAMPEP_0175098752 /NCGR_PEP_ID=MMETSP0086_2-20121207/6043_1 /TAXON_ID=136419 /ORGANISM="Unknown Unknown, Strain D1" /LENGTH=83 /DNA_ID=CAMNT_0016372461 /DNA_START=282 /DNA_END=533 /DNA_ORIENTATION=-